MDDLPTAANSKSLITRIYFQRHDICFAQLAYRFLEPGSSYHKPGLIRGG